MKTINIKILDSRVGKDFPLPSYVTSGSAGLDLRACIDEEIKIKSDTSILVKTGLGIYIADKNLTGIIIPRSGLGHYHGIILGNVIGLIDSDYQGELMVSIWNRSKKEFLLKPGNRIAQLIFIPIIHVKFNLVKDFNPTVRGKNGFGHSGYK